MRPQNDAHQLVRHPDPRHGRLAGARLLPGQAPARGAGHGRHRGPLARRAVPADLPGLAGARPARLRRPSRLADSFTAVPLGILLLLSAPWATHGLTRADLLADARPARRPCLVSRKDPGARAEPGPGRGRLRRPAARHRAGPARRHPGAAGGRGDEAGPGQGQALRRQRRRPGPGHPAGRGRAPRRARGDRRPAHAGPRHPPAGARQRPGRRARHPGGPQRGARRAGHRHPGAALGRDRDHRLLLRRRTARQRGQAQRREARYARGRARPRPAAGPRHRRRRRRRRPAPNGGLRGLAERVRTVDGRIEISSPQGGPTTVTVELPSHA